MATAKEIISEINKRLRKGRKHSPRHINSASESLDTKVADAPKPEKVQHQSENNPKPQKEPSYAATNFIKSSLTNIYKPSRKKYSAKEKKGKAQYREDQASSVEETKAKFLDYYGFLPKKGNPARKHYLRFFK